MAVDPDRADVPKPASRPLSDYYDFVENAVLTPGKEGVAMNVNTLGEVPVSSWYAGMRHYADRRTQAALRRGPLRSDGPSTGPDGEATWTVVGGKSEGKSPGLTVEDAEGRRFLFKFDGVGFMELSTGAEAIATRIVYALGYRVPENDVVRFARSRLVPGDGATYETTLGEERPLDAAAIDTLLSKAARYDDGTYRALASLYLPGEPLGPFQYHGTRADDGNDIFPHERRRELRGFRLVAAWLHHDDSRSVNTLDTYVTVTDSATGQARSYVRHHLIDFGTTLGGGPLGPKDPWIGNEYIIEPKTVLLSALTLGFLGRPWAGEAASGIPSVGRLPIEAFDPEAWRPQYHNPAFDNMDADDAFWMARQIAHFTNDELRALAETGRYTNPRATAYVARALVVRRDAIARAYLGHGGGFDRFAVTGGEGGPRLRFADVVAAHAARQGANVRGDAAPRYAVTWFGFDNATGRRTARLASSDLDATPAAPVPAEAAAHAFVVAALRRTTPAPPTVDDASGTTEVYLRRASARDGGAGWQVVGVRRHAEGLPDTVPVWTILPDAWRVPPSEVSPSGIDARPGDG